MNTCVQKIQKDQRLLSIEECILFQMLKKVSGKSVYGKMIKDVIDSKDYGQFRQLIKDLGQQLRSGKDCREVAESIIGIHAANKILALTR
jgi:hypothetical protein